MHKLPVPEHMPCERCGASVATADAALHECDERRRLEFELFQLRSEVAGFEEDLSGWLDSVYGRFEQFYAERNRDAV